MDFSKAYSPSTYGPLESKLRKHISRAYNIWSLGCILLEFITWLLGGSAAIEYFADVRGKIRSGGINDGNYFTITLNRKSAIIRQYAIDWVDRLHCHKRCSAVIHLLLDFIMNRLPLELTRKTKSERKIYILGSGLL